MDETVGTRIEGLAKDKGLPAGKELAALFGVSYETLRKWREGDAAPNRSRQQVIAERLGVAPEAFMFGTSAGRSAEPLRDDEARLLRSYRRVLKADKTDALRRLEQRAREIEELEMRIIAERAPSRRAEAGVRASRVTDEPHPSPGPAILGPEHQQAINKVAGVPLADSAKFRRLATSPLPAPTGPMPPPVKKMSFPPVPGSEKPLEKDRRRTSGRNDGKPTLDAKGGRK